ncbi:MAG: hypothetical protein J6Q78_02290 [Clostridia bacterium]|nr:hypothetical protein [Clostridia bacterium]
MLYNNQKTPAFSGANGMQIGSEQSKKNNFTLYADNSEANDFDSFDSSYSSGAERQRRQNHNRSQRNVPPPKNNNSTRNKNTPSMFIALGAIIAVLILIIVIIVAIVSSNKNITLKNNVFASYTDSNGINHVVINGKDLEENTFENDIVVTPALDHSFAYVTEAVTEGGYNIYYTDGKKIKPLAMGTVSECLAFAEYKPGVIYRMSNGYVYLGTADDGGNHITSSPKATSFVISGDASTVAFNDTDASGNSILSRWYSNNITSITTALQPVKTSIDGSLIYSSATSTKDNITKVLYVIEYDGDEAKTPHMVSFGFEDILEMNVDGDEIIFSAPTGDSISSYIYKYKSKKPDKYQPQIIGKGEYHVAQIDSSVVCLETFKDAYLECENVGAETTSYIACHVKKLDETPELVSTNKGKFTPDGNYFYYTMGKTLYKIDLSKLKEKPVFVFSDVEEFEVTSKGSVYFTDSNDRLYYHKGSAKQGVKEAVSDSISAMSVHEYTGKLYVENSTTLSIKVCQEEKVKNDELKLDSDTISSLPFFFDQATKNSFVAVYDKTTGSFSLYYTSNGKSFKSICGNCSKINGISDPTYFSTPSTDDIIDDNIDDTENAVG